MSDEAAIAAFRVELRHAFEDFQAEEKHVRSQYARAVRAGEVPPGADDDELLERPTRRFLIDRMLRALDWNPDDPGQVVEEARSWDADDERLYLGRPALVLIGLNDEIDVLRKVRLPCIATQCIKQESREESLAFSSLNKQAAEASSQYCRKVSSI